MTPSQTDWSEAEDRKLLRGWLAAEPPKTTRELAAELEKSKSAVYRRISAYDADGRKGDRAYFEQLTGKSLDPVIKPVRVDTDGAPTGRPLTTDFTALVWGDVHFPFQSDLALSVLTQVARDLQPELLVCLGDIYDFYSLSDHRPPRSEEKDLQRTLNLGTKHLAEMIEIAEPDRAVYLSGNHEDRWERMMLKAREDVRFRELLKVPKIRRSLDFQHLVGFDELGYEFQPYTEGETFVLKDRLVITHGEFANKYASKKHLNTYGTSVLHGHVHSFQSFTRRTLKGQEAGWSLGCLCDLSPHYDNNVADWQHGFGIVRFAEIGDEWYFDVDPVRVHDGKAIVDGHVYRA